MPPAHGRSILPGLVATAVVAAAATALGRLAPVVGAPVIGIVAGILLSRQAAPRGALRPGIDFAASRVLQFAVVLLGAQLSLHQVAAVGIASLPVMLTTLGVCLALTHVLGRRLGIDSDLRILIGVGTGICGASAIAAVSPTIRAKSPAIAYAISTIFLFNIAAVLAFPPLGHLLGLSQHAFGLFAGTAVNDTSSVVAAAASYGTGASDYAVVVKLTRTLLIVPICLVLAAVVRRRDGVAGDRALSGVIRLVPWFLAGFLLVAAANSLGWIPGRLHDPLHQAAVFGVTVALTAIGMSTDLGSLRRAGPRPLLLGLVLWAAVTVTSLLTQGLVL